MKFCVIFKIPEISSPMVQKRQNSGKMDKNFSSNLLFKKMEDSFPRFQFQNYLYNEFHRDEFSYFWSGLSSCCPFCRGSCSISAALGVLAAVPTSAGSRCPPRQCWYFSEGLGEDLWKVRTKILKLIVLWNVLRRKMLKTHNFKNYSFLANLYSSSKYRNAMWWFVKRQKGRNSTWKAKSSQI